MLLCWAICLPAQADQVVSLTFTGDVTLGGEDNVRDHEGSFDAFAAREGYAWFLARMQPLFAGDDLTVVNLEGVIADSTRGKRTAKSFCFRAPTAMTQVLTSGSVEAANLANNHARDYGRTGAQATIDALEQAGIASFGADRVFIFEKGNVKIAFFGLFSDDYYKYRSWFREEIPRLRREEGVDAVVFSFHAGYEYRPTHNPKQEEYAHAAIDAGADLVIMHHPHVLQGMEVYGRRSILYSLGNFCFGGNKNVRSVQTMAVRAELHFSDDGEYLGQQLRLYPAHISGTLPTSNYQPLPVSDQEAEAVLALVQHDTDFPLEPFDPGAGCVIQPYLPAR